MKSRLYAVKKYMRSLIVSFAAILTVTLQSCGVYSFTGTTLSSDLKTISIQNFGVSAAGGPQNMGLKFNEDLKEYYQRNTSLKLVPADGDLQLSGSIIRYEMTPVAATAGDRAATNRLNIDVEVSFINTKNEKENFDKTFSFFQDFSQEQSLSDAEPTLVPRILEQLILNIFNDTAAQW
jgi:hypothetical protein